MDGSMLEFEAYTAERFSMKFVTNLEHSLEEHYIFIIARKRRRGRKLVINTILEYYRVLFFSFF